MARLSAGAAPLRNRTLGPGDYSEELLVGPSLRYRPSHRVHIDVATLVGIGPDSPDAQLFFVLGYDF